MNLEGIYRQWSRTKEQKAAVDQAFPERQESDDLHTPSADFDRQLFQQRLAALRERPPRHDLHHCPAFTDEDWAENSHCRELRINPRRYGLPPEEMLWWNDWWEQENRFDPEHDLTPSERREALFQFRRFHGSPVGHPATT